MKPKGLLVGVIALAAALLCGSAAEAERRVAFVIGNSAYKNATSLPNTINDANAVAALFRSVGFEVVTSRTDLGVLDFKRAVRDFLITAETADIAVVYYAGHGIEVGGTNYLIPVDAKLARDYDVEDEAVALDRIIWALQSVKRLRLILLDACRDNPFVTKLQRSVGVRAAAKGGLGKIDDVSADTLVAYAAKAGSVSYDGDGANSPFATALLRHIAEPGVDIRIALGRVRDEVLKLTAGRQEPFIYGSLGGATIPLVPPRPAKAIEPAPAPPPAVAAREPATRPAATVAPAEPNRVERPAPTIANAPPAKAEPAKAPPPPKSQAAIEPKPQAALDPAVACGRDEMRLARLRSDPVPDEVARLQRELSCDKLRPQVQRLFESIAKAIEPPVVTLTRPNAAVAPAEYDRVEKPAPTATPAKSQAALEPPKPQAAPQPEDPALACSRDELRLARLRSDPVPDEVARLQRELSCDKLRAQVQRLFESIATAPPAPVAAVPALNAVRKPEPPGEPAAGAQTRRAAPISQENACARDTERLARVRADPTPDAIARFEKELGCEHIRPQLRRLRESVGQ